MKILSWHTIKKPSLVLLVFLVFCNSGRLLADQPLVTPENSNDAAEIEETTPQGQILPVTAQAIINPDIVIDLEVAATPKQQAMGLMFRDTLPDNRGMFFPFEQAKIARFWMNNVPVALDMIFLKEGQVVAIAESAPPCTTKPQNCPLYGPDTVVDGVIELRSQRAKELGIEVGDSIQIQFVEDVQ